MVTYTYTVTNTGTKTLTNITVIDDRLGGIMLDTTFLPPGASVLNTTTLYVNQTVIDLGLPIDNIATVTTDQKVSATDNATVEIDAEPGVAITKMADPSKYFEVGQVINYTYTVINTGTVTLTGIVVFDDFLNWALSRWTIPHLHLASTPLVTIPMLYNKMTSVPVRRWSTTQPSPRNRRLPMM